MKKQANQTAETYHSEVLEEFLSLGTPEELARTENRMMLAVKIQDAITAKGIGKKQFADMMGQKPSVITKWLSGGHNFTVDTLTDIQRVLGVRLLALEEKSSVQNVYHIRISVNSDSQLPEFVRPTGLSFSLISSRTGKAHAPVENLTRQIAFA